MRRKIAMSAALLAATTALALSAFANEPARLQVDVPVTNPRTPNVILILADDVGFGMNSTFGGAVPTPAGDQLAKDGVRYNQFQTTAQCSPTRAALLTGRNPHRVNMGGIADLAAPNPGFTSIIPKSAATLGRVLKLNGFATAWFGKGHVTPQWEITDAGPFDRWPTGLGFDYFYGFLGGETDQWAPTLYENTTPVSAPREPGYVLDRDLIDHTVDWYRRQKSIAPSRPFFAYLATGSVHSPQQAPPEWIARFRGKFDQGWDKLREETYARQRRSGIIPKNAVLTPRPPSVPAWASLSPEERKIASRLMEAAAAQSAYFDAQLGRLFAALKEDGQWDNTLIIYVNGDNGAAHVGGPRGSMLDDPGGGHTIERALAQLDEVGGPKGTTTYNTGWAWAMNTPFQYWKQMSGDLGGIRNGLTISWPGHVKAPGSIRSQFGFVTDLAPTIYEATGAKVPDEVDGEKQMSLDGKSLLYTLENPNAPAQRTSQYFEINGARGFYKDGWFAGTRPPYQVWEKKPLPPVESWPWELYNLNIDYSQSKNLAATEPAKLAELQAEFEAAATSNGFKVRDLPRGRPERAGVQPFWSNGRTNFTFYPSPKRLADQAVPSLLGRMWSVETTVSAPMGGGAGTIISQGEPTTGWGFYLVDGRPTFVYAAEPFDPVTITARDALSPGEHRLSLSVTPQDARRGAAINVEMKVDGQSVASALIGNPIVFMPPRGTGLGRTFYAPLPAGQSSPFVYTGKVGRIDLRAEDIDD